jgi:hypothetical protein
MSEHLWHHWVDANGTSYFIEVSRVLVERRSACQNEKTRSGASQVYEPPMHPYWVNTWQNHEQMLDFRATG